MSSTPRRMKIPFGPAEPPVMYMMLRATPPAAATPVRQPSSRPMPTASSLSVTTRLNSWACAPMALRMCTYQP